MKRDTQQNMAIDPEWQIRPDALRVILPPHRATPPADATPYLGPHFDDPDLDQRLTRWGEANRQGFYHTLRGMLTGDGEASIGDLLRHGVAMTIDNEIDGLAPDDTGPSQPWNDPTRRYSYPARGR